MESTNWYRDSDKDLNEGDNNDRDKLRIISERKSSKFNFKSKYTGKDPSKVKTVDIDGKPKLVSVMFAPHTENSNLAKRWRVALENFEKIGSI